MTAPPGNSLDADQHHRVSDLGHDLADGLAHLRNRIDDEIGYNAAKGESAYRMGMQDGLQFAIAAIDALITEHVARPTDRS